jgi:tetratricopeptide (TPR) repeat protein
LNEGKALPEPDSFAVILEHLGSLISNEGEYFSHQTALFLLGLAPEPPTTLTIVSDHRRRNRTINGFELVFVYHGKTTASYIQTILFRGYRLQVSTVEKTLIDLTKDTVYAPPTSEVGSLFCRVSYNTRLLLNIARQTSDSVIKRVSLYLAWSGRAAYHELPFKLFKRTPIKLDPRETEKLTWNGLFFTRFPLALLLQPPDAPPADVDNTTRLWMELRSLPELCEKQVQANMIFIRETPEPRINAIIENYFIEIFRNLDGDKLYWLLANTLSAREDLEFPPLVPRLLLSFIANRTDVLNLRADEISDWVTRNLLSPDIELAGAAIYFGTLIGFEEEVVERFTQLSSRFFYAGKFSLINFFAENFLNRNMTFAHNVYLDISKTFSAQERYDEALQLLEEAKTRYEDQPGSRLGHLFYASALVLKRLGRVDEAMTELFLARESFIIDDDNESLARAENALGNIYFSRGRPQSARAHYLAGLQHARQSGSEQLLASFLTNIGLVEYDLGNFSKARAQLSRAYNLNRQQENLWNASVTGMGLGKIFLKMGQFFKAMKIFREVLTIREKKQNLSGMYEIFSLLAWICEILGKQAAAETYWHQASTLLASTSLEARACYVGESLQAMNHIFNMRLIEAENHYQQMICRAVSKNASPVQIGDCHFGLAAAQLFQEHINEGCASLKISQQYLGSGHSRAQRQQIDLLAALYFPEKFPDLKLEDLIQQYIVSGSYDPFWGHIAARLQNCGKAAGLDYLEYHISKTPPSTLKQLISRIAGLKDLVEKMQTEHNRAGEFFTLIASNETATMHHDEYINWQKNYPADHLIFDAPAGLLVYGGSRLHIKIGSIPHNLLLQLFIAQPHAVEAEGLYRSAWGSVFDPEYDQGAFKTTVQRVKQLLQSICPSARIVRRKSRQSIRAVKLSIAVPWILIFK